jgi:polyhydroxyalkanoate synthase subunit PhaC
MTSHEADRPLAESVAHAIGPEAGQLGPLDPAGFGAALVKVLGRGLTNGPASTAALERFWRGVGGIGPAAAALWRGGQPGPPVPVPDDRRFADPAWRTSPFFFALRGYYAAGGQLMSDLLAAGEGDRHADAKAQLAAGFLLDALAPTNFLPTNPAALKRVIDTGGGGVLAGLRNMISDLVTNNGLPRQVDASSFRLGENLAATPGKVVFRNDLMELIQYAPQTAKVHAVPVLASLPWINKYYIMDLAPDRSFLEWAVAHERTVFAISYRNPDARMRGVRLDDYLLDGPRRALSVITDITGAHKIDIVGLCLGGALTAMLAAHMSSTGDDRRTSCRGRLRTSPCTCSAAMSATCCPAAATLRHRQSAGVEGVVRRGRRLPGQRAGLAGRRRPAAGVLVGGLGGVGTRSRGRAGPAAVDRQRPVPASRRRSRQLRPRLTGNDPVAPREHAALDVSIKC